MKYGDVQCVAGGQVLTVRYGNLAWDRLMRRFGASSKIGALLKARDDDEAFLHLVREGLAAYHPGLTLARIRELYDELPAPPTAGGDLDSGGGELTLKEAVWQAVSLSLPELSDVMAAVDKAAEKASGSGPKDPLAPAPKETFSERAH